MVNPYRAMMGPSMSLTCIRGIRPFAHGLTASLAGYWVRVAPGMPHRRGRRIRVCAEKRCRKPDFSPDPWNRAHELRAPHYGFIGGYLRRSNNAAAPFVFLWMIFRRRLITRLDHRQKNSNLGRLSPTLTEPSCRKSIRISHLSGSGSAGRKITETGTPISQRLPDKSESRYKSAQPKRDAPAAPRLVFQDHRINWVTPPAMRWAVRRGFGRALCSASRLRPRFQCSPVKAGASAEKHARHSRPSWPGLLAGYAKKRSPALHFDSRDRVQPVLQTRGRCMPAILQACFT
jgi:hypothetical protein